MTTKNDLEENENEPQLPDLSSLVLGSDDALFGCIERNQLSSSRPFGAFLDAGTGSHSLRWIASLVHTDEREKRTREKNGDVGASITKITEEEKNIFSISSFTAVTADETMKRNVLAEARTLGIEDKGNVVIGNWAASGGEVGELCRDEKYDTILADYLLGAIDGFSPYFQDQIFPKLATHLKPGGRMYVVGLNPIPDKARGDADVFCRVTKLRDACILLAGHRCYREYPVDWVQRHLQLAGLDVIDTSKFPIMYSHNTIVRQLNVARSKLRLFPSDDLANAMRKAIDELEKESKAATMRSPNGRLKLGFDYVITAEMPKSDSR